MVEVTREDVRLCIQLIKQYIRELENIKRELRMLAPYTRTTTIFGIPIEELREFMRPTVKPPQEEEELEEITNEDLERLREKLKKLVGKESGGVREATG